MTRLRWGLRLSVVMLFTVSAVHAELNTVTYISHDGGGDGRVDGDLTGVGKVTLYDGPGGDFWNGGDQGIYLHDDNLVTGDFTATVRVVAQTEAVNGRWGKAGIRASSSLEGTSANAMTQVYAGNGSQIDPPEEGDHSPIPVRIGGRTGNDGQGGFERPVFDASGVEIPNNVFPPAPANTANPDVNKSWLRLQYKEEDNAFLAGYAVDNDGVPGEWGYSAEATDVPATGDGWIVGIAYSAHNSLELDEVTDSDGFHGITFDNYSIVNEFLLPQLFGEDYCDPKTGGDLDGDGLVAFSDFLILSHYFLIDDAVSHVQGDINCDGKVEFKDFLVLAANYGLSSGAAASIPEPSGLASSLCACFVLVGVVRQRRFRMSSL